MFEVFSIYFAKSIKNQWYNILLLFYWESPYYIANMYSKIEFFAIRAS